MVGSAPVRAGIDRSSRVGSAGIGRVTRVEGAGVGNGSRVRLTRVGRTSVTVKVDVTMGEVVDELKKPFGEWREPPIYW